MRRAARQQRLIERLASALMVVAAGTGGCALVVSAAQFFEKGFTHGNTDGPPDAVADRVPGAIGGLASRPFWLNEWFVTLTAVATATGLIGLLHVAGWVWRGLRWRRKR
jgi:hypothetical protein